MNFSEPLKKVALRQGLRPRTIQTYQGCVDRFFRFCRKEPHTISKADINNYLDFLIERKKSPGNTLNVYINALKFFYEQVLHRRLTLNIKYSKIPKSLPRSLEKEEVVTILNSIPNTKHYLIIALLYGTGLRVSELAHLKVQDLDLQNNYGWVREGKGGKDRLFIIPEQLKELLKQQMEAKSPKDWLFPGQKSQSYSAQSIREILKKARKAINSSKRVHPHALRHSFATHVLENGYSLIEVNRLLGHSRMETTMVYAHLAHPRLSRVQSPLDLLLSPQKHPK